MGLWFKNLLKNVAAFAIGLFLVLTVLEIFLRVASPQRLIPVMARPDALTEYRLRPNIDGFFSLPEFEHSVRTNSIGLRGPEVAPKAAGSFRILSLGDSFTFGWGVKEQDAYVRLVEKLLRERGSKQVSVLNAGTPGYGTANEVAYLETYGFALRPDLVTISVTKGDELDTIKSGLFELRSGEVVRAGPLKRGKLSGLQDAINYSWPYRFLAQHSHLLSFLRYNLQVALSAWRVKAAQRKQAAQNAKQQPALPAKNVGPASKFSGNVPDPARELTYALLGRARDLAGRSGVNLLVILRPGADVGVLDYCLRNGIPVLDLSPVFKEAGDGYYYPKDGHWTEKGHALAARAIAETIAVRFGKSLR